VDGEPLAEGAHPPPAEHTALGKISELYAVRFAYRATWSHPSFLLNDATETATI